jgi:hypothetical protein
VWTDRIDAVRWVFGREGSSTLFLWDEYGNSVAIPGNALGPVVYDVRSALEASRKAGRIAPLPKNVRKRLGVDEDGRPSGSARSHAEPTR